MICLFLTLSRLLIYNADKGNRQTPNESRTTNTTAQTLYNTRALENELAIKIHLRVHRDFIFRNFVERFLLQKKSFAFFLFVLQSYSVHFYFLSFHFFLLSATLHYTDDQCFILFSFRWQNEEITVCERTGSGRGSSKRQEEREREHISCCYFLHFFSKLLLLSSRNETKKKLKKNETAEASAKKEGLG
jgi:hypothetical protein